MNFSRMTSVAALLFVTSACATTQKIGNGVATIAQAPVRLADGALSRTERVLVAADKAMEIAERTSNFVNNIPSNTSQLTVNALRVSNNIVRSSISGFVSPRQVVHTAANTSIGQAYTSGRSTSNYSNSQSHAACNAPAQYTSTGQSTQRYTSPRSTYSSAARSTVQSATSTARRYIPASKTYASAKSTYTPSRTYTASNP